MKYIFLALFAFTFCTSSYAQDDLYIELMPTIPLKFRTSPTSPFQSVGFLGKHIKPYLSQNPLSLQAYRSFQINRGLMNVGFAVALIGSGVSVYDLINWNTNQFFRGTIISLTGTLISVLFTQAANTHLYRAVDNFNFGKSPLSAFVPSVQPSQYSVGAGFVWDLN